VTLTPFVAWPDGVELVLASASPRRAELLRTAGIPFSVEPAGDVESALAGELLAKKVEPGRYCVALAEAKANAVASRFPGRLILGADTVVVFDGDILEKPADADEAVAVLSRLSGRRHVVYSAIALVATDGPAIRWSGYERTKVEFHALPRPCLERYVATGEPMDKAGAYGIQGYGALMVRRIEGCYFNVMGLPLARLGSALREIFDDNGRAGGGGAFHG